MVRLHFIQIESKQAHNIYPLFRETTTVTTTIQTNPRKGTKLHTFYILTENFMSAPCSFTRMRAQSRGKKNDFSSDKVYQPLVVTLGELSCKLHILFFYFDYHI